MDILIKNMELPKEKDDAVILTIQPDGTTNIFGYRLLSLLRPSAEIHGLRKGIIKAIELPEHGDLISKKALEVQIAHAFHGNMFPDISAGLALNKVMNIITDAPTIVEASNE